MSPCSVRHAKRVSSYVTVTGGPTVGPAVRSAGTSRQRAVIGVFGYTWPPSASDQPVHQLVAARRRGPRDLHDERPEAVGVLEKDLDPGQVERAAECLAEDDLLAERRRRSGRVESGRGSRRGRDDSDRQRGEPPASALPNLLIGPPRRGRQGAGCRGRSTLRPGAPRGPAPRTPRSSPGSSAPRRAGSSPPRRSRHAPSPGRRSLDRVGDGGVERRIRPAPVVVGLVGAEQDPQEVVRRRVVGDPREGPHVRRVLAPQPREEGREVEGLEVGP